MIATESLFVPPSRNMQIAHQSLWTLANQKPQRFFRINSPVLQTALDVLYRGPERERVRSEFRLTTDRWGNDVALLTIGGEGIGPGFLLVRRADPDKWRWGQRHRSWQWKGRDFVTIEAMWFDTSQEGYERQFAYCMGEETR